MGALATPGDNITYCLAIKEAIKEANNGPGFVQHTYPQARERPRWAKRSNIRGRTL